MFLNIPFNIIKFTKSKLFLGLIEWYVFYKTTHFHSMLLIS